MADNNTNTKNSDQIVNSGESFVQRPPSESTRRTWLIACGATGGLAAVSTAVSFAVSMSPSEKAKSAGAPVEVDLSDIPLGGIKTVEWRGKPVWVIRRTPEMLESLKNIDSKLADPNSDRKQYPTPEYAKNQHRMVVLILKQSRQFILLASAFQQNLYSKASMKKHLGAYQHGYVAINIVG